MARRAIVAKSGPSAGECHFHQFRVLLNEGKFLLVDPIQILLASGRDLGNLIVDNLPLLIADNAGRVGPCPVHEDRPCGHDNPVGNRPDDASIKCVDPPFGQGGIKFPNAIPNVTSGLGPGHIVSVRCGAHGCGSPSSSGN